MLIVLIPFGICLIHGTIAGILRGQTGWGILLGGSLGIATTLGFLSDYPLSGIALLLGSLLGIPFVVQFCLPNRRQRCKHCLERMAYGAKVCPHCQRDQ